MTVPMAAAAASPLLAWRSAVYILAGFAGIFAMVLMLVQPMLATNQLPGFAGARGRRVHRWIGFGVIIAVAVHVIALWITSPPDVVDALLFRSPTPFSAWGVIGMWALFLTGAVAAVRRRARLSPRTWRRIHLPLTTGVVCVSIVHAMLIEGAMEIVTKSALCLFVLVATAKALKDLRAWTIWR
nr:ferric reductase-like transmembrane domain-containing protein [Shimia sp. CNT1-13L.2]